jgi:murein DD-endopeptidase MepM/ murein hydrolase activator NlpD
MADGIKQVTVKPMHLPLPFRGMTFQVTAKFGEVNPKYWETFHKGTDFGCPVMTPVFSVADGMVKITGFDLRLGNRLWINGTDNTWRVGYCHLTGSIVEYGSRVYRGQMLGYSGATGTRKDGSPVPAHLHVQVETVPDRHHIPPIFDVDLQHGLV